MNHAIFTSRPKDIYRYSLFKGQLSFDFFCLHPYHLENSLRPGPNSSHKVLDIKRECEAFKPVVFNKNIPLTRNLQLTLLDYETENKLNFISNPDVSEIYCHNGLFTDLIINVKERYQFVKLDNKLFITGTSLRKNQDPVLSYIGIKFENMLTKQPSPKNNRDHCKALLEGKWGKWNYKSVVEIDAYKLGEKGKKIEEMTQEERLKSYVEIKLCSIKKITREDVEKIKSKAEFLQLLDEKVKHSSKKLEKWLFQSYFGRQDTLIVGLRNENFELICYEELDMFEDILPFVENFKPKLFEKFLNSPKILERKITQLYEQATEEKSVMEFLTNDPNLHASKVKKDCDKVLIPNLIEGLPINNNGFIIRKREEAEVFQYKENGEIKSEKKGKGKFNKKLPHSRKDLAEHAKGEGNGNGNGNGNRSRSEKGNRTGNKTGNGTRKNKLRFLSNSAPVTSVKSVVPSSIGLESLSLKASEPQAERK